MKEYAHRGEIQNENKITSLIKVLKTNTLGIELDVRFNTNRDIVLCHDRENRNDKDNETLDEFFESLPSEITHKDIIIDIKAFGIVEAKNIAKQVSNICFKYSHNTKHYNLYLCSFNEYCVSELCFRREDFDNVNWKIGVIASGIPLGLFNHLEEIDFVSLDYNIICEEIVEGIQKTGKLIYAWVVNDVSMRKMMEFYNVDGLIYDL